MANAASRYCSQVNKHLTCPGSMKRLFLRQLQEEVRFYCEEHGRPDQSSLYAHFGAPETVAEEFLAELSPKTAAKYARRRKKILVAAMAVFVIAAISVGILGLQSWQMQHKLDEEEFAASITFKDDSEHTSLWIQFQELLFGHTDETQ